MLSIFQAELLRLREEMSGDVQGEAAHNALSARIQELEEQLQTMQVGGSSSSIVQHLRQMMVMVMVTVTMMITMMMVLKMIVMTIIL